jgi:hypothetical protein
MALNDCMEAGTPHGISKLPPCTGSTLVHSISAVWAASAHSEHSALVNTWGKTLTSPACGIRSGGHKKACSPMGPDFIHAVRFRGSCWEGVQNPNPSCQHTRSRK